MGQRIIQQPNGKYAVYSTIVDNFVLLDATREDLIEDRVEECKRRATEEVDRVLSELKSGGRPYYQFTQTFEETCDWIKQIHGAEELAKVLGLMRT
jgi:hypothetical protein